jgi:hypothetical protein
MKYTVKISNLSKILYLFFTLNFFKAYGNVSDTIKLVPKFKKYDVLTYNVKRETIIKNSNPEIEFKKFILKVDSVSDNLFFLSYLRPISKEKEYEKLNSELKGDIEKITLKFIINKNGEFVKFLNEEEYYKNCQLFMKKLGSKYDKKKYRNKKIYKDVYFEYMQLQGPHIEFSENIAAVLSTSIKLVHKDSVLLVKGGIAGVSDDFGSIYGYHSKQILKDKSSDSIYYILQQFTPDFSGLVGFVQSYLKTKYSHVYKYVAKDEAVLQFIENGDIDIAEKWLIEHHKILGINTNVNYERHYKIKDQGKIIFTQYKYSINLFK